MAIYIYIYIYIYILSGSRGRAEQDARGAKGWSNFKDPVDISTDTAVSLHNFKSQNFKLSVSNPKSKYVAYLSVLSQISNCQGLGRKNKHEILKTDRIPIGQQASTS